MSDHENILSVLFPETSPTEFIETYWRKRDLVSHGPIERLAGLISIPEIQTLDALCQRAKKDGGDWISLAGPGLLTKMPVDDARCYFDNGWGMLLFRELQDLVPRLREWSAQLWETLDVPTHLMSIMASASRADSALSRGVPSHVDCQDNFVVQLQGSKRWYLSPAFELKNTPTGYNPSFTRDDDGMPPWPLCIAHPGGVPQPPPLEDVSVLLKPGSVLYCPGSYWHRTTTEEGISFSLGIYSRMPAWFEVFVRWMHDELCRFPELRQTISSSSEHAEQFALAQSIVAKAEPELVHEFMNAALKHPGSWEVVGPFYQRNFDTAASLSQHPEDASDLLLHVISPEGPSVEMRVPEKFAVLVEWIIARTRPFSARQAGLVCGESHEAVYHFLAELTQTGLLRP
jgi:ribosomal protein L16 Arg81 hydroxylase